MIRIATGFRPHVTATKDENARPPPPNSPFGTGSKASRGNFWRSNASSASSWIWPWGCCEPCSALRRKSSICRCIDATFSSFSRTRRFNAASVSCFAWSRTVPSAACTCF
jgi:hypothetical protein